MRSEFFLRDVFPIYANAATRYPYQPSASARGCSSPTSSTCPDSYTKCHRTSCERRSTPTTAPSGRLASPYHRFLLPACHPSSSIGSTSTYLYVFSCRLVLALMASFPMVGLGLGMFIFFTFIIRVIVTPSLALLFVASMYSMFWFPQIIRSAKRGRPSALSTEYIIGTSICRLYFALCEGISLKGALRTDWEFRLFDMSKERVGRWTSTCVGAV